MSVAWGDAGLLLELIDRQFEYFLSLRGSQQLIQIRALTRFLHQESRVALLLEDFRAEAREAKAIYRAADRAIRASLKVIWSANRDEMRGVLEPLAARSSRQYLDVGAFFIGAGRPVVTLPDYGLETPREQSTKALLVQFHRWSAWRDRVEEARDCDDRVRSEPSSNVRSFTPALVALQERLDFASSSLQAAGRGLPWAAYRRLLKHAKSINPPPPSNRDDVIALISYQRARRFAEDILTADDQDVGHLHEVSIDEMYRTVERDARLLHHELRHRIGLGRSRRAIVERYAARCASFDADDLRARAAARSGAPERELTLHFARYLFDQGLNPLLDPTISGLKPDVMHLGIGEPLYVEAKQYNSGPERTLRKAYDQVWSTWLNVRQQHPSVTEAFLVVFRRGGPFVQLPETIRYEGLKLHSVLVDISEARGSREPGKGIHLTAADLLPAGAHPP